MGIYDHLRNNPVERIIKDSRTKKNPYNKFSIIDERNFDKYINSDIGTKFLYYLKKKDFRLWQILANNQRRLKYLPREKADYLSKKKDALFSLFNEFHIKNTSYYMYANQQNMNKILCSSIGKDYLSTLQKAGYKGLYNLYKQYGFRKMPKDQVLFVHLFNQFVRTFRDTGKKNIDLSNATAMVKKRARVAKAHYKPPVKSPVNIAKTRDMFYHPVRPLAKLNGFTIFNNALFDKGLLRFIDKKHADSFFANLKQRCSKEKLLSIYNNLKDNRYNGKREDNLWVNLNNIEPDYHDKKARRFKEIVLYLHKYTMPDNVVVFPYLNNTAYKNWPKSERIRFITFCRENMTEDQYMAFTRQVRDVKVDLPAWAQVELWWAELNFMNPSKLLAEIHKDAKLGPLLSDRKSLAVFIAKHRREIAEGKLRQVYVYMDGKDSKGVLKPRIALIPNNFGSAAYFTMVKGRHLVYKTVHDVLSPRAIESYCAKLDEWNIMEKGFSYLDIAVIPSLAKLNNETVKTALLEMYGIFMFFRHLYNPVSWTRFIVGLSRLDKDVAEAVKIWKYGSSEERALLMGTVMGLIFGPKAFGKINELAFTKAIIFENGRFRVVSRSSIPSGEGIKASIMDVIERHSNGNPKKVRVVTQKGSVWESEYGMELGEDGFPVSMSAKKVGKAPRAQRPSVKVTEGKAEPVKAKPKSLPPTEQLPVKAKSHPIPDPSVVDTVVGGMNPKERPSYALVKATRKAVANPKVPKQGKSVPNNSLPGKLSPKGIMGILTDAAKTLLPPELAPASAAAGGSITRPGTPPVMAMEGNQGSGHGNESLSQKLTARFNSASSLADRMDIIQEACKNGLYGLAAGFYYKIGTQALDILESPDTSAARQEDALTVLGDVIADISNILDDVRNPEVAGKYLEELVDGYRACNEKDYIPAEVDGERVDFIDSGEEPPAGEDGFVSLEDPVETLNLYRNRKCTAAELKKYAQAAYSYSSGLMYYIDSHNIEHGVDIPGLLDIKGCCIDILTKARELNYPGRALNEVGKVFSNLLKIKKIAAPGIGSSSLSLERMNLSMLILEQYDLYLEDPLAVPGRFLNKFFLKAKADGKSKDDLLKIMDEALAALFKDYYLKSLTDDKIRGAMSLFINELIQTGKTEDSPISPAHAAAEQPAGMLDEDALSALKQMQEEAQIIQAALDRFFAARSLKEKMAIADEMYENDYTDLAIRLYAKFHDAAVNKMTGLEVYSQDWITTAAFLGGWSLKILNIRGEWPGHPLLNQFFDELGKEPYLSFWTDLNEKMQAFTVSPVIQRAIGEMADLAHERGAKKVSNMSVRDILTGMNSYKETDGLSAGFIKKYFSDNEILHNVHPELAIEYYKDILTKIKELGYPVELYKETAFTFKKLLDAYLDSDRVSDAYTNLEKYIRDLYDSYKKGEDKVYGDYLLTFLDGLRERGLLERVNFEEAAVELINIVFHDYFTERDVFRNPGMRSSLEKLIDDITEPGDINSGGDGGSPLSGGPPDRIGPTVIDIGPAGNEKGGGPGRPSGPSSSDEAQMRLMNDILEEFEQTYSISKRWELIEKAKGNRLYDLAAGLIYRIGNWEMNVLRSPGLPRTSIDHSVSVVRDVIKALWDIMDQVEHKTMVEDYIRFLQLGCKEHLSGSSGDRAFIKDPSRVSGLSRIDFESLNVYRDAECNPDILKKYANEATTHGYELLGAMGYARAEYSVDLETLRGYYIDILAKARELSYPANTFNEICMVFSQLMEIEKIKPSREGTVSRLASYMGLSSFVSKQLDFYTSGSKETASPSLFRYFSVLEDAETVSQMMDQCIMFLFKDYYAKGLTDKEVYKIMDSFIDGLLGNKAASSGKKELPGGGFAGLKASIPQKLNPYKNNRMPGDPVKHLQGYYKEARGLIEKSYDLMEDKVELRDGKPVLKVYRKDLDELDSVRRTVGEYYKDILLRTRALKYPPALTEQSLEVFDTLMDMYTGSDRVSQAYINLKRIITDLYTSYCNEGKISSCDDFMVEYFKIMHKEGCEVGDAEFKEMLEITIRSIFVAYYGNRNGLKNPQLRRNLEKFIDEITEPTDINTDPGGPPPSLPSGGGPPNGGTPSTRLGPFSLNKVMDKINEAASRFAGGLGLAPKPVTPQGIPMPVPSVMSMDAGTGHGTGKVSETFPVKAEQTSNINAPASVYNETVLPNGVKVITESNPVTNFVSVGVLVKVGSIHEASHQRGISHFLEHMAFKDTGKHTEATLNYDTEKISVLHNAQTSFDHTFYYMKVKKENLGKALELLEEMLLEKKITPEAVERERGPILAEIEMYNDSNSDKALQEMLKAVFEGGNLAEPLAGTEETVKAITPQDLKNFEETQYTPDKITVLAAGNLDHSDLVRLAGSKFGSLKGRSASKPEETLYITPKKSVVYKECEDVYLQLTTGIPLSDMSKEGMLKNQLFMSIIRIRLIHRLRTDENLAHNIDINPISLGSANLLVFSMETPRETLNRAIEVICDEMKDIMENGLTDEEFDTCKTSFKKMTLKDLEKPFSRMEDILLTELTGTEYRSPDEVIKMLEGITKEDVLEAASSYLNPNKYVWSVYGPLRENEVVIPGFKPEAPSLLEAACPVRPAPVSKAKVPETASVRPAEQAVCTEEVIDIPYAKTELPNGVKVITETHSGTKFVSLGIYVNMGTAYESETLKGISRIFTAMTGSRATENYDTKQLVGMTRRMLSDATADAGKEYMHFTVEVLKEDLEPALKLLYECFFRKKFDPNEVEMMKQTVLFKLKAIKDHPGLESDLEFGRAVFKDSPLGESGLGDESSVSNITSESLKQYTKENFPPGRIILACFGDVAHEDFVKMAEVEFGKLKGKAKPLAENTATVEPRKVVVYKECEKVYLDIAAQSLPQDSPMIELFKDRMFKSIFQKRLFKRLRSDSGLVYEVFEMSKLFKNSACLRISTSMLKEKVNRVIKLIIEEMEDIRKNGITEKDLELIKSGIVMEEAASIENPLYRNTTLGNNDLMGFEYMKDSEYIALAKSITVEDINRHCQRYLDPSKYLWHIYGPVTEEEVIVPCFDKPAPPEPRVKLVRTGIGSNYGADKPSAVTERGMEVNTDIPVDPANPRPPGNAAGFARAKDDMFPADKAAGTGKKGASQNTSSAVKIESDFISEAEKAGFIKILTSGKTMEEKVDLISDKLADIYTDRHSLVAKFRRKIHSEDYIEKVRRQVEFELADSGLTGDEADRETLQKVVDLTEKTAKEYLGCEDDLIFGMSCNVGMLEAKVQDLYIELRAILLNQGCGPSAREDIFTDNLVSGLNKRATRQKLKILLKDIPQPLLEFVRDKNILVMAYAEPMDKPVCYAAGEKLIVVSFEFLNDKNNFNRLKHDIIYNIFKVLRGDNEAFENLEEPYKKAYRIILFADKDGVGTPLFYEEIIAELVAGYYMEGNLPLELLSFIKGGLGGGEPLLRDAVKRMVDEIEKHTNTGKDEPAKSNKLSISKAKLEEGIQKARVPQESLEYRWGRLVKAAEAEVFEEDFPLTCEAIRRGGAASPEAKEEILEQYAAERMSRPYDSSKLVLDASAWSGLLKEYGTTEFVHKYIATHNMVESFIGSIISFEAFGFSRDNLKAVFLEFYRNEILYKSGKITAQEFEIIKTQLSMEIIFDCRKAAQEILLELNSENAALDLDMTTLKRLVSARKTSSFKDTLYSIHFLAGREIDSLSPEELNTLKFLLHYDKKVSYVNLINREKMNAMELLMVIGKTHKNSESFKCFMSGYKNRFDIVDFLKIEAESDILSVAVYNEFLNRGIIGRGSCIKDLFAGEVLSPMKVESVINNLKILPPELVNRIIENGYKIIFYTINISLYDIKRQGFKSENKAYIRGGEIETTWHEFAHLVSDYIFNRILAGKTENKPLKSFVDKF
ncbi:MAG: pitrilysin family protein, partial [Armatimonadota bacterium]